MHNTINKTTRSHTSHVVLVLFVLQAVVNLLTEFQCMFILIASKNLHGYRTQTEIFCYRH